MKLFSAFLIFVCAQTVAAQKALPEWLRVHTFDDRSAIELNTDYVLFSTDQTARVRLRWLYNEPQSLSRDGKTEYRSILQEVGFDCAGKKYLVYETVWLGADEKRLQTKVSKKDEEWRAVYTNKTIETIFPETCKLIALRRREPVVERPE